MPRNIFWLVLGLLALAIFYFTTRTGIQTDSRKQEKAKAARQHAATTSATDSRAAGQRWEDSAHHYHAKANEKPIVLDSAGVVRLRKFWADFHPGRK